uniref:Peptidase S1 domain-containing protein n=1 Tax=Ciona intestinalis TaxID=7719 RepID=H2Y1T3_CIOIN
MGKYGFLLITSAIVVLYNTVEVSSQCQSIGCGDCYTWCAPVHCSYPTGQLYCRATCGSCPNEQCRAAGCSHTCNPNTNPVTCTCNAGYELQADGKTCLDINECERSSNLCTNPTSPRCKNTPGSYICTGCGADSNTVWQYYNRTECCKIDTASQCGTSSTTGGRIVGGELAVIANWPWSAYIKIGSTLCTGALIKRNVVLTAAHCLAKLHRNRVTNLDELRIYLGVQNISDTGNIHSQHIAALRYVQHPNFDSSTLENDIAIIFLRTEATIGDYVNTICLPNGEQIAEGTKCWATGYGAISEGGPLSQTLRQVALPIANSQTCVQNYARISRTVNPVKTMCAGYEQGGRDSCQGDSGGPLVCQRCNSCNWFLAGLVSFGRGCARVGMFGIYSRMTYFEQWIASQTGMNHSPRSCVRPSWSNWSAWSQDCPSCGAGTRTKTRSCTNGVVGDPGCDGSATMTGSCPNNPCSSGSWGDYQQWSTCTVSCGGGTRTRTRSCNGGSVGSIGCPGEESQTEPCNTYNCPGWNNWGNWGECTASCGGGTREATRTCNTFGQAGATCSGDATKSEACNTTPCPTWGASWGDFGAWSACTASCNGGTRTRTRSCNQGSIGSNGCPSGGESELEPCNTFGCPRSSTGSWDEWTNSGGCSLTCGGGTQQQTRTCTGGTAGAGGCPGSSTQTIACNQQACPPQGSWSGWSNSGTCTVTCGGGTQQQIRTCNGGTAGAGGCPGSSTQTIACNQQACPPQGSWGGWSNSGTCSLTCGGGTQQQIRTCNGGTAGAGGCPGSSTQTIAYYCNTHNCPAWNNWGNWGECTASCGGGTKTATRTCNTFGQAGASCNGLTAKSEPCNTFGCPTWNDMVWNDCSVTCGGGTRTGTRTCNRNGGTADCVGSNTVTGVCGAAQCGSSTGSWSGWSNSGTCTFTCGGGTQRQTRTCNGGTAGATDCSGSTTQTIPCNEQTCPPQGSWGSWTNNGTCSLTCGGGIQQQTRACNGGTAGTGGCPGSTTQTIACNGQACPSRGTCSRQTVTCGNLLDLQPSASCPRWVNSSYCNHRNYASYMLTYCAKSCCIFNAGKQSLIFLVWIRSCCIYNNADCSNAFISQMCANACNPL